MRKFRKKPVEIEAIQYTGPFSFDEMVEAWGEGFTKACRMSKGLTIVTLEGILYASPEDWIIRGVKGEFYPIKPDIFAETYEPVAHAGSESK